MLIAAYFVWVLNELLSSWDGVSQLSQIIFVFVVNLKKSFKVIVEPEKIEQIKHTKPDR